ncbi:APC family permease [Pseudonocardia ailaonensis]|uniref:APC family permease n=1 Tax=Pseudonocardia ailaonensis TaxID=367279 RepID=A0ABN2NFS0_9PSEU
MFTLVPEDARVSSDDPRPARLLSTSDAVVVGLGAMIGAGIFVAPGLAAAVAGPWLLLGLAIAAAVAFCNAAASAQLAAQYPTSGGTYVYGRERLGPWWGFLAGWSFVIGKTASCAAMALTAATYLVPAGWQRPVAVAVVVAITAVNCAGVTRTARVARVVVVLVLVVLAVVVVGGFAGPVAASGQVAAGPYGVLQAAGLLFFAFAGYARVATLGEEVRDPRRAIPRAIGIALTIAVALYALVTVAALHALGPAGLAASPTPLADVAVARFGEGIRPVVAVGGGLAAVGALLALVAGVGRTVLAMAREGDLPRPLAAVHPRFRVPHRAELAVGTVVAVLVATTDLRGVIGFSSFGVLLYYLVANLAAYTQEPGYRRYPRALQVAGALGCALLVVTLPPPAVLTGAGVLAVGIGFRQVGRWGAVR